MSASFDIAGAVAVITGGARGIGYSVAAALHEAGAKVVIVDLDLTAAQDAAAQLGPRAMGLAADVADLSAMTDVVDRVVDELGSLDLVVANAGIGPCNRTLRATDPAFVDRTIEVNLLGVWRTVHPALPHLIASGGHIVVVSSVYAFVNGALTAPYAMAKAGVEQLGRALRTELSPHGVSVTTAYYGFVDTDLVRNALEDPVMDAWVETFPGPLRHTITPTRAAEVMLDGIRQRRPRVIAPRRWWLLSVLRGVLNPLLDRRSETDRAVRDVLIAGDRSTIDR